MSVQDQPTHSTVEGSTYIRNIIDAVNSIPNEAARRMVIAALKIHDASTPWVT